MSHMVIMYRLDNPLYGINGKHRICRNELDKNEYLACERGKMVWYSA